MRRALVTTIIGLAGGGWCISASAAAVKGKRTERCTYTFSGSYDLASSVVKPTLRGIDTRPSAPSFR